MRRFVIALVLFLGVSAGSYFLLVDDVAAIPPHEVETFFYSDATLTTEVGWRFRPCTGPAIMEGSFSPYKVIFTGDPC